jgi:hypothetical protein
VAADVSLAQALFGDAGQLPQGRCARADWVDCGLEGDGNARFGVRRCLGAFPRRGSIIPLARACV